MQRPKKNLLDDPVEYQRLLNEAQGGMHAGMGAWIKENARKISETKSNDDIIILCEEAYFAGGKDAIRLFLRSVTEIMSED